MDGTLRSNRLKRWTVSLGRRERDRIRSLPLQSSALEHPRPRKDTDEIARDRGVVLLLERGGRCSMQCNLRVPFLSQLPPNIVDPPGSRLPLHLASISRAPTLQHISDRINLISAQHNLSAPSRTVASLMMLAFEVGIPRIQPHITKLVTGKVKAAYHSHPLTHFYFPCNNIHQSFCPAFKQPSSYCIFLRFTLHALPCCASKSIRSSHEASNR